MTVEGGGIELGNLPNTTFPVHDILPKRLQIASNWGDYSNAGYNDSSVTHGLSIPR